jgi:hypothetical protein
MRDGYNVPERVLVESLTSRTATERSHYRALQKTRAGKETALHHRAAQTKPILVPHPMNFQPWYLVNFANDRPSI